MQQYSQVLGLCLFAGAASLSAHPGSGIVVDSQGQVYFVDTGEGVWKIDSQGKLSRIGAVGYHWMAIDEKRHFARSGSLGEFDRGSFERITPPGLIISSDYPITVGADGGLYYVPYKENGPRELIRKMSDGSRTVFAKLPDARSEKPMQWVNGIATGPGGALYMTDNEAILRVNANGMVSKFRGGIDAPDCTDPLPEVPQKPYLRGLAVSANGTVYAAANGCRSVIAVPSTGAIRTILKSDAPWSPTGVALSGDVIYVLEYLHTPGDDRKAWIPRVRKVGPDGRVSTIATVERRAK